MTTSQVRVGHSDPRLTIGLYAQATTAADRAAAERLGSCFLPSVLSERVKARDGWHGASVSSAEMRGAARGIGSGVEVKGRHPNRFLIVPGRRIAC